jgi:uncharacterized protein YaaQ
MPRVRLIHWNVGEAAERAARLRAAGYVVSHKPPTGGFLREGNATILVGTDDDKVDEALATIRENCHTRTQYVNPLPPIMEPGELYMPTPIEVEVGGATVFVLGVERAEKF